MHKLAQRSLVIYVDLFVLILLLYLQHSSFSSTVHTGVDLTSSRMQGRTEAPQSVVLTIKQDGALSIGGKTIDVRALPAYLEKENVQRITIAVDKRAYWDKIGAVFDIVSRLSMKKVYIVYEKTP